MVQSSGEPRLFGALSAPGDYWGSLVFVASFNAVKGKNVIRISTPNPINRGRVLLVFLPHLVQETV